MGRCYVHLDLGERRKLAQWRAAKIPMKEIALRLGRPPCTLYREIRRNFYRDEEIPDLNGYHAVAAQTMSEKRRACHRKLVVHSALKAEVIGKLVTGWSPEQIAGRLRAEAAPIRVSHETIYRYAYSRAGRAEQVYRHLPERRRQRRPRVARRRHGKRFPEALRVAHRPAIIGARGEFGHWEGDLVLFRQEFGQANITTLVERVSRYTVALRNGGRQSKPVMETMIAGLSPLPAPARRSITLDRGTEFTAWAHLHAGLGVDTWYCDPQAPWQKGTIENTNGRLRRYLPRKSDPTAITNRYLRSICDRLNATPRKCLDFRTPAEVFREKLMEAAGMTG